MFKIYSLTYLLTTIKYVGDRYSGYNNYDVQDANGGMVERQVVVVSGR